MKKIISLVLVAVMLLSSVVALSSCGKDDDVLVMATNAAFPPYEFIEGGKFAGIDVEIATEIAKKLNKELKIEDVEFGSIIGGVAEGKYDMGMAGLTVTEVRKKSVNFSDTYATGVQVIIVKDGSAIKSLDDLFVYGDDGDPVELKNKNIKIGVQQDTTGDIYSSDDVTNWGFNDVAEDGTVNKDRVTRFKTGAEAVEALKTNKVDMVIIDNEPAKSFVKANTGIHILEGDNEYVIEDYAICVAKDNTKLLEQINNALKELKEDGTIDKIVKKYINDGSDK